MTTATNAAPNTGNESATTPGDWVEAHGDYLFNFAIGQLRDASVAEDLVQDTFLAAFKTRDRFSAKSSERTCAEALTLKRYWHGLLSYLLEGVTPAAAGRYGLKGA